MVGAAVAAGGFLFASGQIPLDPATGGLVSADSLALVRVGQESGSLAAGLRAALGARGRDSVIWGAIAGRLGYLCALVLFASLILSFSATASYLATIECSVVAETDLTEPK